MSSKRTHTCAVLTGHPSPRTWCRSLHWRCSYHWPLGYRIQSPCLRPTANFPVRTTLQNAANHTWARPQINACLCRSRKFNRWYLQFSEISAESSKGHSWVVGPCRVSLEVCRELESGLVLTVLGACSQRSKLLLVSGTSAVGEDATFVVIPVCLAVSQFSEST